MAWKDGLGLNALKYAKHKKNEKINSKNEILKEEIKTKEIIFEGKISKILNNIPFNLFSKPTIYNLLLLFRFILIKVYIWEWYMRDDFKSHFHSLNKIDIKKNYNLH